MESGFHASSPFRQNVNSVPGSPASVRQFLDYLMIDRNVAASTQNQALNALLFLFRHMHGTGIP